VDETELKVESIELANELLEQLGFYYKNYQEKRRISYRLNGVKLEIDFWPLIPPYLEIEADSEQEINDIISLLEFKGNKVVSCNTEELYKIYGLNIYDYKELRFDGEKYDNQYMLEFDK
jgi:adenylate cyclase class 2